MNQITVVDARMGRGKSSAAIRYMNQYKDTKRFLYITPFLDEVDRICTQCDFDQSDGDEMSKSSELKLLLESGENIAATHALFYLMDAEALDLVREQHYSLIIDESIQVIEKINICASDLRLVLGNLVTDNGNGVLSWKDEDYNGVFNTYKNMADAGCLWKIDSALFNVMSPAMLRSFDEVYMLTYMFDGQYQKAYLDYFGFDYRIVGIEEDEEGYRFSDKPDAPPPIDYKGLIHIIDTQKMNKVGDGKFALSKAWFDRRGYNDADIRALRSHMISFYRRPGNNGSNARLWTTFKASKHKLIEAKTGRFGKNFLQVGARATNEYHEKTDIAYLANRFVDPNITKFFAQKGVRIDTNKFALSEMLQWIWRSAIRDDKPIDLYVPSSRMRKLLTDWMEEVSK